MPSGCTPEPAGASVPAWVSSTNPNYSAAFADVCHPVAANAAFSLRPVVPSAGPYKQWGLDNIDGG